MTIPLLARFFDKLEDGWQTGTLVKLTLSDYAGPEPGLRNGYGRVVELKDGFHLAVVWRYATRDVTKNLTLDELRTMLAAKLGTEWKRAHLFTTTGDWQLRCESLETATLKASRPTFAVAPPPTHDREKKVALDAKSAGWLRALGVTNAQGEPRPGMADKLRQIQRFVELLGHLIDGHQLLQRPADDLPLRVADMGAGKGYLTFATAEFFRSRGVAAEVVGVEARPELVELTNQVARAEKVVGLSFVRGSIGDWVPVQPPDVLIALHACDTATDDALAQAVRGGASLILAAPCCHKEVRQRWAVPGVLRPVLRHGILAEREAEVLTDGLRALVLEIHGYEAKVFEFISPEHTGKNLMLSAERLARPVDPEPLRERLRELMEFYGLREQRLVTLLAER